MSIILAVESNATVNLVGAEILNWTVRSNTWAASQDKNPITGVMKFRF